MQPREHSTAGLGTASLYCVVLLPGAVPQRHALLAGSTEEMCPQLVLGTVRLTLFRPATGGLAEPSPRAAHSPGARVA